MSGMSGTPAFPVFDVVELIQQGIVAADKRQQILDFADVCIAEGRRLERERGVEVEIHWNGFRNGWMRHGDNNYPIEPDESFFHTLGIQIGDPPRRCVVLPLEDGG